MACNIVPNYQAVSPPTGTAGAPVAGTWIAGSLAYDSGGVLWLCTASGTPGAWAQVGGSGLDAYASSLAGITATTTSASYVTALTGGATPSLSIVVPASGKLFVNASSYIQSSGNFTTVCTFALSGANTLAAADGNGDGWWGGAVQSPQANIYTGIWSLSGLTAGATTIQIAVKVTGGTSTFSNMKLYARQRL